MQRQGRSHGLCQAGFHKPLFTLVEGEEVTALFMMARLLGTTVQAAELETVAIQLSRALLVL